MGGNKSKEQEKVSEQGGSSSSPVAVQKSSPAPSGAPANATSPSTVLSSTTSTTTEPKPELPAPAAAAPAVKVAAATTVTSERTSVAADEQQKQALEQAKAKSESEKLELTPLKVPRAAAAEQGDRTPMEGREVSVRSDSSSSSLSSYAMAESIGVGRCVDLLLFSPEEVKVFQEALSVIAGNADNEADYPLEEDLWELAKEKLAALMSPSLRLLNCKATMVYVIKTYVDRKARTVVNKAKVLPEIRAMVLKQVTELLELVATGAAPSGGKSAAVVPAAVYEKDYWLWSGAANQWIVPELAEPFPAFPMKGERMGLLKAIFSADPVKFSKLAKDIARDVHVLMTLPNYLEYEESTPIEKSRLKNASNDGAMKSIMRGQMARRVLLNVLPERTVLSLVPGAFESVDRIMSNAEKLCEKFLAQPLVVPVFKEQKKKAEKSGKAKGGDAKAAPAPKAAAASPAPAAASNKKTAVSSPPPAAAPLAKKAKTDAGNCCSSASTTTTPTPTDAALQKLRTDEIGSVLYYKYVVSHQNGSSGGSGSSSQQLPSCTAGATTSAGVANAAAAAVGQNVHVEGKFDTVWCGGGKIPQGHTGYSFTADSLSGDCVPEVIERSKFGRVWAATEGNVPQGHTPYSFFFGTAAAASASSSSTAPPAKAAFSPEPRAVAASPAPAAGKKSAKPSAAPASKPTSTTTTATSSSSNNIDPEALAALKKLDLRVGQIVKVERIPISEGLYKTQVDMGGGVTRQICGGLVKHYPEGETQLLNRKILTFFNIKPAKLAGESSEGMILAGAIDNHGPNEQCELLELGEGGENVEVGTKLTLKNLLTVGEEAATTSSKNIHKQWQKAQPLFSVDAESRAMFGGKHEWVVVGKDGKEVPVRVPTLKNAAIC